MRYRELIANLPLPTIDQTSAFVDQIIDGHSWYKHLPLFPPGATFVFYLDPHAGCVLTDRRGTKTISEIVDREQISHYNQMLTVDYRERFGYWNYAVTENPRFFEPQITLDLYGPDGTEVLPLPSEVNRECSCGLTAFVRPSLVIFALPPEKIQRDCEVFRQYSIENPNSSEVMRYNSAVTLTERALKSNGSLFSIKSDGEAAFLTLIDNEPEILRDHLLDALKRSREYFRKELAQAKGSLTHEI